MYPSYEQAPLLALDEVQHTDVIKPMQTKSIFAHGVILLIIKESSNCKGY